jgi:uncharacterized protein
MVENYAGIRRFNCWDGFPELGFKRELYLQRLNQFNNSRLVKVLVGQRRVGKSYILRQHMDRLIVNGVEPRQTLYVNKEYTNYDFIQTYKDLDELVRHHKQQIGVEKKVYLFVDEIQLIQDWEKVINSLSQDYTQEIELFITGSNSELLSGELATLLSGRYVQFTILPFGFEEYSTMLGIPANRSAYMNYLRGSGLPELFQLQPEAQQHYVGALRDTVLLRDIIQRHAVKDPTLLLEVFNYLCLNNSNLFSVSNIVNYYKSKNRKVAYETLANYIEYLLQTFILYRCERYDVKGKTVIGGNAKYYLNDLAFKHHLFSGYAQGTGYMLENLVYLELKRAGFSVFIGHLRDKEVDFVAQYQEKSIYLQVALDTSEPSTLKREYASLLSIQDNFDKWIVTLDEFPLGEHQGIKHIPAWELFTVLEKWKSI